MGAKSRSACGCQRYWGRWLLRSGAYLCRLVVGSVGHSSRAIERGVRSEPPSLGSSLATLRKALSNASASLRIGARFATKAGGLPTLRLRICVSYDEAVMNLVTCIAQTPVLGRSCRWLSTSYCSRPNGKRQVQQSTHRLEPRPRDLTANSRARPKLLR